jgi:hypothetical protein
MKDLTFEHICEGTQCKNYIVWDFGHADCYSCTLIGESYHVTNYPDNCPFKSKMQAYEREQAKGH